MKDTNQQQEDRSAVAPVRSRHKSITNHSSRSGPLAPQVAGQGSATWRHAKVGSRVAGSQWEPDELIEQRLTQQFRALPHVDASNVQVEANEGRVLLTGTVPTSRDASIIDGQAISAPGVRRVTNQLTIRAERNSW